MKNGRSIYDNTAYAQLPAPQARLIYSGATTPQQQQPQYNNSLNSSLNSLSHAYSAQNLPKLSRGDRDQVPTAMVTGTGGVGSFVLRRQIESGAAAFTWRVRCRDISGTQIASNEFVVARYPWRMVLFERDGPVKWLSFYLAVADFQTVSATPNVQYRDANFTLKLLHQDPAKTITKRCDHRYAFKEVDWGFNEFVKIDALRRDPGFIMYDSENQSWFTFEVILKESSPDLHSDKTDTAFVGIKNQGATCYLNSLLQTYFHLSFFQRAVHQMPVPRRDDSRSTSYALQKLFYSMLTGQEAAKTEELTKSFGWSTNETFLQHDIQELNRVLVENLEERMKDTPAEGTMNRCIGKVRNYIKCRKVPYESHRDEDFYDLTLCVSGCSNIIDAFKKEVETETLQGDNLYNAAKFGMQEATKGLMYLRFPPVLFVHLRRFEYDVQRGSMRKVTDDFRFDEELDLAPFGVSYTKIDPQTQAKQETRTEFGDSGDTVWKLFAVLVHCGTAAGGHYYAFVRPGNGSQWYKFDDDKVTAVSAAQAIQDNYGGKDPDKFWISQGSVPCAYMFVYVQRSEWGSLIQNTVRVEEIQRALKLAVEESQEKKPEDRKHFSIRFATVEDFERYDAQMLHADLIDIATIDYKKYRKDETWESFVRAVAAEFHLPPKKIRFWKWSSRKNHTYRPDTPCVPLPDRGLSGDSRLFQVFQTKEKTHKIDLFIETCKEEELAEVSSNTVFLHFKYYDPAEGHVRYKGHRHVNTHTTFQELTPYLNGLISRQRDAPLMFFEEVTIKRVDTVEGNTTPHSQELGNGDIIIFQEPVLDPQRIPFPFAVDVFQYLSQQVTIQFVSCENQNSAPLIVEVHMKHTIDSVCQRLCKSNSSLKNNNLRLYNKSGVACDRSKTLQDYIRGEESGLVGGETIMYYEELPIPFKDAENMSNVVVRVFSGSVQEITVCKTLMDSKKSTVGDLLREIRRKVPQVSQDELDLCVVDNCEIRRVFSQKDPLSELPFGQSLRADPRPPEEAGAGRFYVCVHFDSRGAADRQAHISLYGHPFRIFVSDREYVRKVKQKIQEKLELRSEFKLALIRDKMYYHLQEDDVFFNAARATEQHINAPSDSFKIGLDHRDIRVPINKGNSIVIHS